MSLLSKKPTIGSKENTTRTLGNGRSNADKKNLILNPTRPTGTTSATVNHTRSQKNGPSTSAPAPKPATKQAAAVTLPSIPAKNIKVEKKTTVANIPTSDYKAKFNDLLEKHNIMKAELNDLTHKHGEVAEENKKMKDSLQSCSSENLKLIDELSNTRKYLKETCLENEKLKLRSNEVEEKNKVIKTIYNNLQYKHEKIASDNDMLKEQLLKTLKKVSEADKFKFDLDKQKHENESLHHTTKIIQQDYKEALESITKYKDDAEALQNILASMYKEQRDLRNTIQDLKGNIRVFCRVRPPLESERTKPLFNLNVLDACSIEVEKCELLKYEQALKGKHSFSFDGIFTPDSSQEDVFTEVSAMVQSALDGYNVCIFAYGQTGSGKTYTMEGDCGKEQSGIIPRAFNMIFTCMEDLKRMGWVLTIRASFLEIYNEIIYDLLNSSKDQQSHVIKMVNSKGADVYVSNLKEEEVKSSYDFIRLFTLAQCNRTAAAATLNNERSSRSHSVAQIKISAINEKRKEKYTSNLNLVDLAGSECVKTTHRMDETEHINRSLSVLSKVILSLQTKQTYIPYKNSKLTHLLMPSLGGNSKTLMLVNINQFDEYFSETLNSLRFATQVNSCRTIKAKKNLSMVDSL